MVDAPFFKPCTMVLLNKIDLGAFFDIQFFTKLIVIYAVVGEKQQNPTFAYS